MKVFRNLLNWYFTRNAIPYWTILIADCLICYLSGILVFWLYYHGVVTLANLTLLSKTICVYMLFNLIGFRLFHTYAGVLRYSSFVDLQRVGFSMIVSCFIAEVMHYVIYYVDSLNFIRLEGRQIFLMYLISFIGMIMMRVFIKTLYDIVWGRNNSSMRTLIFGVKDGAIGLAKDIRNNKKSRFFLKGFISPDGLYQDRILLGESVYGVGEGLASIIDRQHIHAVLVSPLQNALFRQNSELQDILINAGVKIFMATESKEWDKESDFEHIQLKEISIEDLLPRDKINVDMDAIGTMLRGRKIMITGSAGSIGSEMVRQIAQYDPSELILIDQAETPQHDIRLMLMFQHPQLTAHTIVASIANKDRMEHIFDHYRPDYVFHAAAYKHVPMMEDNPSESVQNNVWGTKVIADLSVKYGVKKFVMISTDKAVNPTNVMGCSKRICEIYCQSLNHSLKPGSTQFVTTRFGNVLGSNGSVIPLFERQIRNGGPVTVTDPNIVRFFMLIPEACQLVLEAGTHGKGGEIFVFDMGAPVKIVDLARRMINLSGARNVEIKFTGLRAGEKLYEEVLSNTENTLPSFHEKIRIAQVRQYDYAMVDQYVQELIAACHTYDNMAIVAKMKELVPEYVSNNSVYSVLDQAKDKSSKTLDNK